MSKKASFELPREYVSLVYLHIGTVKTLEYMYCIWNSINSDYSKGNIQTVRIKTVIDEGFHSEIILTGLCSDVNELLRIANHLKTRGIKITYEPTILMFEV